MKKTTLVVMAIFAAFSIHGQQTIPASGGEATGSGTVNYTLGQLVYTTNTGSGTVTQGVQQSFELYALSNPELTTVNVSAVTYPNPTLDYVVLAISDINLTDFSFTLYDVHGKTIAKANITMIETQIPMMSLASGMYILKINQNNQELKTFKIIKK